MKKLLFLVAMSLLALVPARAVLHTTNWTAGAVVPDNNFSGWVNSQTVGAAGTITPGSLLVCLELTGGWNGDLYAYLLHDTGFAVLLDRVGYTGVGCGYGTAGMSVWLTDGMGIGNIETTAAPNSVNAGSPYSRSGYAGSLSSFDGLNAGGTWTLFIAHLSSGGVTTVQSWGLQMDIVAVPEVETWVSAAMAGAFGAFWLNRQMWGQRKSKVVVE
jgi:subtilisin-like proprotein convertase family protein